MKKLIELMKKLTLERIYMIVEILDKANDFLNKS